MNNIKYRKLKGYKYQLWEDHEDTLCILGHRITTPFIELYENGHVLIKKGYAWDGPSGPTIDTKTFMRGSLLHDIGYQLSRMGLVEQSERGLIDMSLRLNCIEDGMNSFRAWYIYYGVRTKWGELAAKVKPGPMIYEAPSGNKFRSTHKFKA